MNIYVDATTLIALGEVDELDLLTSFDGKLHIPASVKHEVTTEPANNNLKSFIRHRPVVSSTILDSLFREEQEAKEEAKQILREDEMSGDVGLVAGIIISRRKDTGFALVSDDRRLRTVAEGLGARVTGTIGVVVRAVAEGRLTEQEAKELVRCLDNRGLHMTGELREKADELIEDAAWEVENTTWEDEDEN